MAIRSTGTATITFGLVSAPAKLYTATESKSEVSFHLLHAGCGSRLKQQYVCAADGQVVERDRMDKGYEHAKGQFVTFTADEIKALQEEASEAIDVVEFVKADAVDPIYFDKAQFLAPDKGGQKAFALILEAMRRTGRHAIGKYAARGKQSIVLLRPYFGGMVVHTLRYGDEVRDAIEAEPARLDEETIAMAVQLVEAKASDCFDPSKYRDEVKERMLAAIAAKIEGAEAPVRVEKQSGQVIDLMEALKASLRRAA